MQTQKIEQKLLEKSVESFMMAIEVYNKPSIKYRVEGFAFFICNAWELMLKSHIIKKYGEQEIYYPDNPKRTISLENCIEKVFTNNKDPLRINLKKIVALRNTSTHFVVEEYEMVYIPLFQACVYNYTDKIHAFHNYDIESRVPSNFLTLSVNIDTFDQEKIRAKYPKEIAEHLIGLNNTLIPLINSNNGRFAIRVEHYYYLTKDEDKASAKIKIDNSADATIKVVKELKDPNDTHKYNVKACCAEINKRLKKLEIDLHFNRYHFSLFCQYYDLKNKPQYSFGYKVQRNVQWSYSQQTIDFIVGEIKKDPEHIIENLKQGIKK